MGKLLEMKQKMDEAKQKLDTVNLSGEAEDGKIQVIITGNRKVKEVKIDPSFLQSERKEELEELLVIAVNRAIEKSNTMYESEMASSAMGFLPGGFPGL